MSNQPTAHAWREIVGTANTSIAFFSNRAMLKKVQELGLPPNWFLLWFALEHDPKPFSGEVFAISIPYMNPARIDEQLDTLSQAGYLTAKTGSYQLTDAGREAVKEIVSALNETLGDEINTLLPPNQMERLDVLYKRYIEVALSKPSLEQIPNLERNRHSDPGSDVSAVARIQQYLTDNSAFSDDCHIAAWRKLGVDGPTWEAFSRLADDETLNTPQKIHERLSGRNFEVQTYETAFETLVNKGWIAQQADDTYALTDAGREVREAAEQQSDAYYAAAWEALGDDANELYELLEALGNALQAESARIRKLEVWSELQQSVGALAPYYLRVTVSYLNENNMNGPQWGTLFLANGFDPDPLTVERLALINPFTHHDALRSQLETVAEGGFLQRIDDDTYAMTDQGRTGLHGFFATAHEALQDVAPLPEEDLQRLHDLLSGIVERTVDADKPESKLSLSFSRKTDPGSGASLVAHIDQYATDLQNYRGDAHFAVIRESGVDFTTWNAFTQVWNGGANTVETISEAVQNRQHPIETYQQGLDELVTKDWLTVDNGTYQITPEGQYVRDAAERETDANFFVGWQALSDDDINDLETLAKRINRELKFATYHEVYDLTQKVSAAFAPYYQPVAGPIAEKAGWQGGDWFMSLLAWGVEPEPLTDEIRQAIAPYRNYANQESSPIDDSVERGFLVKQDGGYGLSDSGREAIQGFFTEAYASLGNLVWPPEDDMQAMHDLLKRMIDGIADSDVPGDKLFFTISRVSDPGEDSPLAARIDQYVTDLARWRDDAHVAAWQDTGLTGPQLETLTFIWHGEHTNAAAIAEQRPGRRFEVAGYQAIINELVEKGLVKVEGDSYAVTDEGRKLREDVEVKTDDIFFTGWNTLFAFELNRLRTLLTQLHEHLEANVPQTA